MEYIVYATLTTGKTLTGGVIEAVTPEAAIESVRRKYIAQGEKYGSAATIKFEAQEAPNDEDDRC